MGIIDVDLDYIPIDPANNHWIQDADTVVRATDEQITLLEASYGCIADIVRN